MRKRFLYHSFPRLHAGETQGVIPQRGLQILSNLKICGFVFAPEIVSWRQNLTDGDYREFYFLQKRICFTELDPDDLSEHAAVFGPFSLEFEIDVLRHLGAIPVSYVPQALDGQYSASGAGITLVVQTWDAKCMLEQMDRVKSAIAGCPEEASIALTNSASGEEDHVYTIPTKALNDFFNWLGYKAPPLPLMYNVLHGMLNRFYPTDDIRSGNSLSYYYQYEWRMVDDIAVKGVSQVRPLQKEEKGRLLLVDQQFWQRELVLKQFGKPEEKFQRIDKATVFSVPEVGSPLDMAKSIIVPIGLVNEAVSLLGQEYANKIRSVAAV